MNKTLYTFLSLFFCIHAVLFLLFLNEYNKTKDYKILDQEPARSISEEEIKEIGSIKTPPK